jgi:hypothetical protein
MMYPDRTAIQGSFVNLRQSGLIVPQALAGMASDAKGVVVDLGSAYLASNSDVTKVFGPALVKLRNFSEKLPPPFGEVAGFALGVGVDMQNAVQRYLEAAGTAAGAWLSVEDSTLVINAMVASPLEYWKRAAKDKMAQEIAQGGLLKLAVQAWNLKAGPDNRLDFSVTTRLADALYLLAKDRGADQWAAAMVAYKLCQQVGSPKTATYAALVRAGTPETSPEAAWAWQVKRSGKIYSASGLPAIPPPSEGAGGGAAIGIALLVGALALRG